MPTPATTMTDTFEQARSHFVDGVQAFEAGRLADAERAFAASLALVPGRPSTLTNLGAVRLRLGRPGEALADLDAALAVEPDNVDALAQRADALARLGRHTEALAGFERVLALDPDHAATALHRAALLGLLGRHAEALAAFDRLVQQRPRDVPPWIARGQSLHAMGRPADAAASYDRALALDAGAVRAWTLRGDALCDAGRPAEAAASYEQAIAHGGEPQLHRYLLASLDGAAGAAAAPPPRSPDAYVRLLFDGYAQDFDRHLVQVLRYEAHERVARLLTRSGRWFDAVLDLGCGTGLLGPLLKHVAGRIDGVDLSPPMLAKARTLGVYDRLDEAELVEYLQRTERRYDAVVAADVFIYVGDLEPVFAGVARVLAPGGHFTFSLERADDAHDYVLLPSRRYAQSERWVRELAARHGLDVLAVEPGPIRDDQRHTVHGLYVDLQRRD
ncbi:MAG: tetratricopeptide repeat protein [Burkholderiaceae bacterium]|nr:tetratricopeptide repeat protein [Burkholderiaceae bacterium]